MRTTLEGGFKKRKKDATARPGKWQSGLGQVKEGNNQSSNLGRRNVTKRKNKRRQKKHIIKRSKRYEKKKRLGGKRILNGKGGNIRGDAQGESNGVCSNERPSDCQRDKGTKSQEGGRPLKEEKGHCRSTKRAKRRGEQKCGALRQASSTWIGKQKKKKT